MPRLAAAVMPVFLPGVLAAAFFLAVGVAAVLQVVWELRGLVAREGQVGTPTTLLTFLAGLVAMYATDLFVAL